MREGNVVEEDMPRNIYLRPRSAYTATFLGETNLIAGKVVKSSAGNGMCQVESAIGSLTCPTPQSGSKPDSIWVAYRPEGMNVTAENPGRKNVFAGDIKAIIFTGDQVIYKIEVQDQLLQAKTDPHNNFSPDERVFVELSPEKCLLIPREREAVEDR